MTAAQTSIDCYYGRVVRGVAQPQQQKLLAAMKPGKDYSLSELSKLTGIEKSTVSARVNAMRAARLVESAPVRKCSITGVTVRPVRLPREPQGDLAL